MWGFASTSPTGVLQLMLQRHFATSLSSARSVSQDRGGAVTGLTVALDYRSDALVVWEQGGSLLARELPASGPPRPTATLAPAGPDASVTALLSDNGRATVAWSERRGEETSVYVDRSAAGVRFASPRLLERFADPEGIPPPPASPRLVRLSSESVMLAWAGARTDAGSSRPPPSTSSGRAARTRSPRRASTRSSPASLPAPKAGLSPCGASRARPGAGRRLPPGRPSSRPGAWTSVPA